IHRSVPATAPRYNRILFHRRQHNHRGASRPKPDPGPQAHTRRIGRQLMLMKYSPFEVRSSERIRETPLKVLMCSLVQKYTVTCRNSDWMITRLRGFINRNDAVSGCLERIAAV